MFMLIAILFVVVGVLLFLKSTKMPPKQGLNIVVGILSVVMVILGIILLLYVASGNIELPLL